MSKIFATVMNGPGLSHDICVIEQPGGESGWINKGFVLWPKENCTCVNKTDIRGVKLHVYAKRQT